MTGDDAPDHWRATRGLMAFVIVLWLALGAGIHLVAADRVGIALFGAVAGYILAALVSPFALVGLLFWFADRQDRIDRDFGTAGED